MTDVQLELRQSRIGIVLALDKVKSGIVVPVMFNNAAVAVIKLYSEDGNRKSSVDSRRSVMDYVRCIFTAGLLKGEAVRMFIKFPIDDCLTMNCVNQPLTWWTEEPSEMPKGQQPDVFRLVVSEGVFNANLVYAEVDWYYRLGLPVSYFQRFSAEDIAKHVHAFVAGKKLAATAGDNEDVWIEHYRIASTATSESVLYIAPIDHPQMV